MTHALDAVGIWKSYGEEAVLRGVSLHVDSGEIVCLLGPSGCGKSTLARICTSLLDVDRGEVRVNGRAVRQPDAGRIMIFQEQDQIFPWKTVRGNVEFPLKRRRYANWKPTAEQAIADVGLAAAAGKYPYQLSGGMRQRVALARALALRPAVLVMDEPFAHLDASLRRDLQDLLCTLVTEYRPAVLFVTHDINEAVRLADRIALLGGNGVFAGEYRVEAPRPRESTTREFRRLAATLLAQLATAGE